ncbi:hypothetical protein ACNQVK_35370 [Mycobacterium sp. 134]|uniref:hypothetical protein n=1 Tax=Mycobacterium sp. 134 TaxID=3400425 RepID=UPI003AAC82E5
MITALVTVVRVIGLRAGDGGRIELNGEIAAKALTRDHIETASVVLYQPRDVPVPVDVVLEVGRHARINLATQSDETPRHGENLALGGDLLGDGHPRHLIVQHYMLNAVAAAHEEPIPVGFQVDFISADGKAEARVELEVRTYPAALG